MAVVVGRDGTGEYAVVECDRPGCFTHVALRPVDDGPMYDLLCEAFDIAQAEGWLLAGLTYCPAHTGFRRDRMVGRVGEGYGWAEVARRWSPDPPRPS